jgi:hypothetical protein
MHVSGFSVVGASIVVVGWAHGEGGMFEDLCSVMSIAFVWLRCVVAVHACNVPATTRGCGPGIRDGRGQLFFESSSLE